MAKPSQQSAEAERPAGTDKPGEPIDLADIRQRLDMADRKIEELTEQLRRQGEELAGLGTVVRQMTVSRPRELSGEEALEIMEREPSHRFLVVAPGRGLGLRVGDLLDPRAKFGDPVRDLPQHILGGLRIAATGP